MNKRSRTNPFKEALKRKEFVITCEVIPGRGAREPGQEAELAEAARIAKSGLVHAISLTDNPGGNPALLADACGGEFECQGLTSLVHFTCKDRNRNQILSQLYALERQGVQNLLVMSGDYPVGGWQGRARPVFDLDPVQVLMLLKDMHEGLPLPSPRQSAARSETLAREIPTNFFAGAVVNPFKYTEGEALTQYAKLTKKLSAGAEFLIAQLGYDMRKLGELQRFVRAQGSAVPILANVFVLSLGAARLMRAGSIAGCHVSDDLFMLLQKEAEASDKGRAQRLLRAAQMVAIARGMGFAGVHLGGFGLTVEVIKGILASAEELQDSWQELAQNLCYGEPDGFYYYEALQAGSPVAHDSTGAFALNGSTPAPLTQHERRKAVMRGYRLSRFFHHVVLTKGKGLYPLLKGSMMRRERKRGRHRKHGLEHIGKALLYGCLDCGDCGLESCVYSCPMAACPKCQRNGPCGGSTDGWCEVYLGERYCIWYKAYYRLKKYGKIALLTSYLTPPNNWDLFETSGWSNYVHERDNAARRIPLSEGGTQQER